MKGLKHWVFWPPFLLVVGATILSFINKDVFVTVVTKANDWLIANFGWFFSVGGLIMVAVCIWVFFSPLGKIKIGGSDAKPLLNKWNWFAITLCTTIAAGLTFWGIVEPVYHMTSPPASLRIEPGSPEAAIFSMSTMFLHWTITPYAIYTVPGLMFAFVYYNMGKSFSLGSTLSPLFGDKMNGKWGNFIDVISLFTLALGMASALGTSILNLSGGVNYLSGMTSGPLLWAIVAIIVVSTFIISASSGLLKGIRILSDINLRAYILIALFIFITGPTAYILSLSTESFGSYLSNFFEKSLFTGAAGEDPWPHSWTTFYWANWFSWAAITALFLGRVAYGYTIRQFIIMNFIAPASIGVVWMSIFSGTAISMLSNGGNLGQVLLDKGPEAVLYAMFGELPLSIIVIPFYLLVVFLSMVTASDSNMTAMGGISSTGISPNSPEPGIGIKIVWGVTVGLVAWVMISYAQIEGIKMLSNLGGAPAILIELLVVIGLIKIARNPYKYDKTVKGNQKSDLTSR